MTIDPNRSREDALSHSLQDARRRLTAVAHQEMFSRFGLIFWGLLLVLLDFNINGFDILPDVIGYILVAIGCAGLSNVSPRFSTAGALSWIMLAVTLIAYFLNGGAATGWGFVHLVVDGAMMWFLLGGVMELAASRQRMDLSERASNRRVAYLVLMSLASVSGFAMEGSGAASAILAVGLIVCIFVLLFLILHLIHRVKHELAGDQAS